MNEATVLLRNDFGLGTAPGVYCACLARITDEDIDRGYHPPCGRSIKLELGEPK
jgi:hypothetical protein